MCLTCVWFRAMRAALLISYAAAAACLIFINDTYTSATYASYFLYAVAAIGTFMLPTNRDRLVRQGRTRVELVVEPPPRARIRRVVLHFVFSCDYVATVHAPPERESAGASPAAA